MNSSANRFSGQVKSRTTSNGNGDLRQPVEKVRSKARRLPSIDGMVRTARRELIACLRNAAILLPQQGVSIRYDTFTWRQIVDGNPLTDHKVLDLVQQLEEKTGMQWPKVYVRDAVEYLAELKKFSSLVEWLDGLPAWDQEPRMDGFFASAYQSDLTPNTLEFARILFLSAVARGYEPGCKADYVVMMIGAQGVNKSTGIEALCPMTSWFADGLGATIGSDRDAHGLQGKWLFEFAELAAIGRAKMEEVKSYITRKVDHYRPPYGHEYVDRPRQGIFVGTTNEDYPLHDVENRRFLPVRIKQPNLGWITANRDQIWAEAVFRYKAGEKWWTTDPELVNEAKKAQEEARLSDVFEEILEKHLQESRIDKITMIEAMKALSISVDRCGKSEQMRVAKALKKLGLEQKRDMEQRWYQRKVPKFGNAAF